MTDHDDWLPRTPLERLIKIDTILADIVPRITTARQRIIDILPGHSGRPAGTGDPGGGRGASTTTIVERTAMHNSDELDTLNRLDQLVDHIRARTLTIAVTIAPAIAALNPPLTGHARELAWVRWLLRQLIQRHTQPPPRQLARLWADVDELDRLVDTWAAPRPGGRRSRELAVDDTDTWCCSCLRAGHRNHRHELYATEGLCRWCGDFKIAQGRLPSLEIIDAHESGSSLRVAQLIKEQRAAASPSKRRRKRKR